jgi:hypothetical protein
MGKERFREPNMNTVDVLARTEIIDEQAVIDGASLIRRLVSERRMPAAREAACIDNPPLTLYGAFRQGVADHAARRANPYRAGSRFWALWEEGRLEAETSGR